MKRIAAPESPDRRYSIPEELIDFARRWTDQQLTELVAGTGFAAEATVVRNSRRSWCDGDAQAGWVQIELHRANLEGHYGLGYRDYPTVDHLWQGVLGVGSYRPKNHPASVWAICVHELAHAWAVAKEWDYDAGHSVRYQRILAERIRAYPFAQFLAAWQADPGSQIENQPPRPVPPKGGKAFFHNGAWFIQTKTGSVYRA